VVHTRDSHIGLNAPDSNTYCGCKLQDRNLILIKSNIRKGLFCQKKKIFRKRMESKKESLKCVNIYLILYPTTNMKQKACFGVHTIRYAG
jgi:hypothetical protein